MKKLFIKNIVIIILGVSFFSINISVVVGKPGFEILPEATNTNIGNEVNSISVGGSVWDRYKDVAYGEKIGGTNIRAGTKRSLGDQLASGIMTWDTLLDYAVYLIKFLGQIALLAGALGIIYYGYVKATEHLKGTGGGKLGKVVMGILVISFAYVIIKMIWSMFVS